MMIARIATTTSATMIHAVRSTSSPFESGSPSYPFGAGGNRPPSRALSTPHPEDDDRDGLAAVELPRCPGAESLDSLRVHLCSPRSRGHSRPHRVRLPRRSPRRLERHNRPHSTGSPAAVRSSTAGGRSTTTASTGSTARRSLGRSTEAARRPSRSPWPWSGSGPPALRPSAGERSSSTREAPASRASASRRACTSSPSPSAPASTSSPTTRVASAPPPRRSRAVAATSPSPPGPPPGRCTGEGSWPRASSRCRAATRVASQRTETWSNMRAPWTALTTSTLCAPRSATTRSPTGASPTALCSAPPMRSSSRVECEQWSSTRTWTRRSPSPGSARARWRRTTRLASSSWPQGCARSSTR